MAPLSSFLGLAVGLIMAGDRLTAALAVGALLSVFLANIVTTHMGPFWNPDARLWTPLVLAALSLAASVVSLIVSFF
jgi:hypothetical protein